MKCTCMTYEEGHIGSLLCDQHKGFTWSCILLQVLTEVAGETLSQLAAAPKAKVPQPQRVQQPVEYEQETEEDDLAARLQAIRS